METRTGVGSDLDKLAVAGLDGFVRLAVAREDLGVRELGRKSLRERRDLLPLEASVDELLVLKCHRLMSQNFLLENNEGGTELRNPNSHKPQVLYGYFW